MIAVENLTKEVREIYPNGVDCHRDYEVGNNGIIFKAFEDGKITVDKLLDHIDLKLTWYIPSLEAVEFFMFIRLVLGEEPENLNSKPQYFLIDSIFKNPNIIPFFMARGIDMDDYPAETVVLCSREFSKSVLTTFLILYMAYKGEFASYGKINYGLYVSDSMRNGVKKMMGRLKAIYYESEFLQGEFEFVSFTQEETVMIRHPRSPKEIKLFNQYVVEQKKPKEQVPGRMKRTFKVDGLGAATSSRGASNALTRPQFVFIDDVVANEVDATSDTILSSIESTIEADIRGGLSGSGYFMVVIGTPYNKKDPVYKRVESGLMLPVVFPRAAKIPLDTMKSKEFESVWPDRHTFKKCRIEYRGAKKAEEDGDGFKMKKLLQEHYLRITNSEDQMIKDNQLQWYSTKQLMPNIGNYNLVMTTDYTASNELRGDFSVVYMWAINSNRDWFLLDMSVKRQTIEDQFQTTIQMVQKWISLTGKIAEVAVELDGQQRLNVHSLKEAQMKHNVWFTFSRQIGASPGQWGFSRRKAGGDKHMQFMRVHHMFQNGHIFLPEEFKDSPDMVELLDEIKYLTYDSINSKHDDALDGISAIGVLDVVYPGAEDTFNPHDQSYKKKQPNKGYMWARLQYEGESVNDSEYGSYV